MIPPMRSREALVTGVGVVNAIANDFESFVEAMREGRCGQRAITGFDSAGLRNPRACEAAEFDAGPVYARRDRRKMDRSSELLLAAFDQAVSMARIDLRSVESARGAVAMGSTLGGAVTGFQYYRAAREGRRRPSKLRDHSMHAPGYRICIESGFLGPNLVFSTACTSSNLALAAALDLVRTDRADVVVAGGFEPLSLISCAGFSVMRNVTPGICRPFDRNRDGLVLGEGSAVLIVEADDFAARRGARGLAAVRGYGLVSDARSMTAPDPTAAGPSTSMRHAMDMAGLSPDCVDWVCAHGTGTLLNDRAEARALRQVFGPRSREVPCTSIKSMIGHTLGAAGAMNAAAALAAGRGDYIPPTIHFEEPDPRDPVACSSVARTGAPKHVLSNSLGFGGSNCSVVIELAGDSGVRE
ncbi:MAG: beta-ketoacyl-[acyl-carrier-protein] synthase family protein [Thiotrichales bacterium]|nr:beta-ketoacyl-[acyl-carrier-protein] synthase family protein [Thiotrichales bacterium]